MLSGRRALQKCHSSSIVRACLRFASSNVQLRISIISGNVSRPQPVNRYDTIPLAFRSSIGCAIGSRNRFSPTWTAPLSTASHLAARPRNHASTFLKPHSKPKFRRRTKEENEEFLKALNEAQAQYEAFLDQQGKQSEARAPYDGASYTSPFFAAAGYDFPNGTQHSMSQQSVDRRNNTSTQPLRNTYRARAEASTSDLERELDYLAHNDPSPTAIHTILKILVRDRQMRPTHNHYEALLLANTWPEFGSVSNVEAILSEMDTEGVEIGANIISAVLKVLAVHPSPELSHKMLAMAERRWIQLSSQTHHHLILGMIRTGQTELAAFMLDVLRTNGKAVRSWDRDTIPDYLVVLLLQEMVKMDDWEGVLRYTYQLRNRRAADREIPVKFWGWLLELASKAAREISESDVPLSAEDHSDRDRLLPLTDKQPSNTKPFIPEPTTSQLKPISTNTRIQLTLSNPAKHLTEYLWTFYVAPMSIRPSWSTCLNILHMASRMGTVWLANSVAATMEYIDGIDGQGRPKAKLDTDVHVLVETAKRNAHAAKTPADLAAEREADDQRAKQLAASLEEDIWWQDLFRMYSRDEEEAGTSRDKERSDNDATQSLGPHTLCTDRDTIDTPASSADSQTQDSSSSSSSPAAPSKSSPDFAPFDPTAVPPGNLWPLFPSIGDLDSAHVDPWEALGPRSSSRRKWTEAQQRFKGIEKARRKKY